MSCDDDLLTAHHDEEVDFGGLSKKDKGLCAFLTVAVRHSKGRRTNLRSIVSSCPTQNEDGDMHLR